MIVWTIINTILLDYNNKKMKKKPLTTYPSIPAPRVDQFTLPQLVNELLRNKEFTKGLQSLFSTCVLSKNTIQTLNSSSFTNSNNNKSILSPTSSTSASKQKQKTSQSKQPSQTTLISQEEECEFIFQQQVRNRMMYPWMLGQNGKEQFVECNIITDEVTDFLQDAIQCSLHKILNKEFINVTNQILAMREEINVFTKEELERTDTLKSQLQRQLEKMQKKLQQQQHISTSILNQPLEKFSRNKTLITGSLSKNYTKDSNRLLEEEDTHVSSIHHEVFSLKKEVQNLKKLLSSNPKTQQPVNTQVFEHLQQKVLTTEQKLSELTLTLKLSLQQQKQKCKKSHQQLCSQLATSTSKEYLSQEIKKSVKSNFKIYLEEIMKCKNNIENLNERIQKNDKGIQDYIGNQLKNIWTLVSGIKIRIQNIEEQCSVGLDQSFIL